MRKLFRMALMLFLVLSGLWTSAQNYSIQKWYNGKSSATVLTFDDWSPGHGPIAVPGLAAKGLVGSFYVTIANVNNWQPILNAANTGNEIGNHTRNHPHLPTVSASQLVDEVTTARSVIASNLPGVKVETMVYPHGDYNDNVINEVKKTHFSARAFIQPMPANLQFPYNFAATNRDYYILNTVPVDANMTPALFEGWIQQAINSKGLLTFTFHSIYNGSVSDSWWDAISETHYLSLLDKVVAYQNQTWVTTYANAVKYHKEAGSATLTTVSNNSDFWVLNLTDTLTNNSVFNHPLTIKLKKVAGETYSAITQNGVNVPFTFTAGNDSIVFNVIPDGGNISINKNGITVAITSPSNNATITGLNPVSLTATASATGTTLNNVTFTVNGQTFVVNNSPYNASWTPTTYGTYTINATANGANGKTSTASISVTIAQQATCTDPAWNSTAQYSQGSKVSHNGRKYTANWWNQNANPSTHSGSGQEWTDNGSCGGGSNVNPLVTLTAPTNGASYTAPASITLSATASDSDGSISKVEFYNGSTLIGQGTLSAGVYSYSWTNVSAGSYSVTARAYDNLNATTNSGAASITVTNPSNPLPVVNMTAPTSGASFNAPASVTLKATATDNGSISKVEFYNGSTLLGQGTLTSGEYVYNWTNVAVGSYSVTAKAYDNLNATSTSSARSISVVNPAPTVSLTSPANNASYTTVPATVTLTATASDNGSISKVEFYQGSTLIGQGSLSAGVYSYTWSNVTAGSYAITAKAFDNLNASTTSSIANITVGTSGGCSSPQYIENGGYVAGSKVKNNGVQYECKGYPYTSWCNGAAWAYAPGTGTAWADAWTQLGACRSASLEREHLSVEMYPNPTSSLVNFAYVSNGSEVITITLVNELSEVVLSKSIQVNAGTNYLDLNVEDLNSGFYLVRIDNGVNLLTKKLSVVK